MPANGKWDLIRRWKG